MVVWSTGEIILHREKEISIKKAKEKMEYMTTSNKVMVVMLTNLKNTYYENYDKISCSIVHQGTNNGQRDCFWWCIFCFPCLCVCLFSEYRSQIAIA